MCVISGTNNPGMFATRSFDQPLIPWFISPRAHLGFVVILSDPAPLQPREQSFDFGGCAVALELHGRQDLQGEPRLLSLGLLLGLPAGFYSAAAVDGMLHPEPGTALRISSAACAPLSL